jgi:hypothetical protein
MQTISVDVPIVITMCPIGTLLSSYLHRQVMAVMLYILDTLALVSDIHIIHELGQKSRGEIIRRQESNLFFYRFVKILRGTKKISSEMSLFILGGGTVALKMNFIRVNSKPTPPTTALNSYMIYIPLCHWSTI